VGLLLGLAAYNGVLLDLHFPEALYKGLLGWPAASAQDLREIDPALAKGLQQLLDYTGGDEEAVFCRSFEVRARGGRHALRSTTKNAA